MITYKFGQPRFILLEFFVHGVSPRSIASCCISGIGFAAALSALMMASELEASFSFQILDPGKKVWRLHHLVFCFFFFVSLPTFALLFYFPRYANLDFLFAEVLDVIDRCIMATRASGWSISLKVVVASSAALWNLCASFLRSFSS